MATKKKGSTAVKTLSGRRLITKELMGYYFSEPVHSTGDIFTFEENGYENFGRLLGGNFRFLINSTYFDLSGYTRNHLTTFPQRIALQESGSFKMNEDATSVQKGAIVLDIICERRITHAEVLDLVENAAVRETSPSFAPGPLEFQQVIYGRYRMFGHDSAIWTPEQGNMTLLNETQWGSGSPTTVDKLLIYRIIIPLGEYDTDDGIYVIVPAIRYLLSATIDEEKDLSYLMRQKRSFELGT